MSTALSRETARMAVQVLLRNPGRSVLTVLGLAIGVGAFIAMVSFGEGARRSVLAQFESLGSNILKVRPRRYDVSGSRPARPLGEPEVAALRREATTIDAIVPVARKNMDAVFGAAQHRVPLHGTTPKFTELRGWQVSSGGMFDALDVAQRAKVCVLGATVVDALFGSVDPLGETLTIGGTLRCRVLGVLARKGQSIGGTDLDDLLLLPASTFAAYIDSEGGYAYIDLRPAAGESVESARADVKAVLRRVRRIREAENDDFDLTSPDDVTRAADQTSRILTGLLAGIAAVSLLVGGIGIMNILLVSVAERTHEIGIRAAIGASPRQILVQFLAEALALAVVGSVAGATIGTVIALLVAGPMGWPRTVAPGVVAGSCAFGIAVGVLFGWIPARRAAALDPIQALRRE